MVTLKRYTGSTWAAVNSVESGIETFQDGSEGQDFETGRTGWDNSLNATAGTATINSLGSTMMGKLTSSSTTNYGMRYTFTSSTSSTSSTVEFDCRVGQTNQYKNFYIGNSDLSDYIFFYFSTDINIWCGNGGGDSNLKAYAANTTYHVKIVPNTDMKHFDIYVDDMVTAEATNQGSRYGTMTSWNQIQCRTINSAGTMAIDNIKPSWLYTAASSKLKYNSSGTTFTAKALKYYNGATWATVS